MRYGGKTTVGKKKAPVGCYGRNGGEIVRYVTERVVNIAELENLIRSAYSDIAALRSELEKPTPSMERVDVLSKQLHLELLQAKDFEFCVERRNTVSLY